MKKLIPNCELSAADIPSGSADSNEINAFALTFDGYRHWGSIEDCARVAMRHPLETLTELRTRLFFIQRAGRFEVYTLEGHEDEDRKMRDLIEKIREKIIMGERD